MMSIETIVDGGPTDNEPEKIENQGETGAPPPPPEDKPAKKSRAKRAVKKAAKAVERAASTAWNIGRTMELHACKLSGVSIPKDKQVPGGVYRSYWAAWQAAEMGGSRGRHIKERGKLKAQLKATGNPSHVLIRPSDGKKVTFTLVKSEPES